MGITTAEKRYVIPQDSAADPNHDTEKKPIREEETEPAPSQDNGGQESAFFFGKRMLLRLIGGLLVLLLFTSGWLLISQRSLVKAVTNLGYVETQTTVTLDTLPANAEVYEEGVLLGTTPFVIKLADNEIKAVTIEHDGYEKVTVKLSAQVPNPKIRLRKNGNGE